MWFADLLVSAYATEAMTPCFVCKITTPRKFILNGLWFGPRRARKVIVFVHGLGSSVFSTKGAEHWADKKTAVLAFNNRGHETISKLRRLAKNRRGATASQGGSAHEIFTDCADDIAGAVALAKENGAREIILAGHSTGCQKSVYYASRRPDRRIKGLVLLAPISDYASTRSFDRGGRLARATVYARAMVKKGKAHDLLPLSVWGEMIDAQRFLSLYTPESIEEIFCYAHTKVPATLKKVRVPMLVVLAGDDEFADRPAKQIGDWLSTQARRSSVAIVPRVLHGFQGKEKVVARLVKNWLKGV